MLESKEFSAVANKAVLFYNDYYEKGGKEPCKIYKIRWFPTVKLIDKDGKELSVLVGPYFDVNLYAGWIDLAEKGITENTALSLAKKGKLSLKDARDFAYVYNRNPALVLPVLESVLDGYNGKNYKDYAFTLCKFVDAITGANFIYGSKIKEKTGKSFESFVSLCDSFFEKLKKGNAPSVFVDVVRFKKKYYFDKETGSFSEARKILQSSDLNEIYSNTPDIVGLCAYVYSRKKGHNEGLSILSKLKPDADADFQAYKNYTEAVETAGESAYLYGDKAFAEACGKLLLDVFKIIEKNKPGLYYAFLGILQRFDAKTKTITLPLADTLIERVKAKPSDTSFYNKVISVYLQGGKKDKAIEFLKTYVDTPKFEKLVGKQNFARSVNSFCWTFVMFKVTDNYLMELMNKSLKIDNNPGSIDTLANLYALKGNFKKAIELEKSAIEILKKQNAPERKIQPYVELIKEWEKKVK